MEVRREDYLDYMTFRRNQRPMFTEIFGPLVNLPDEWRAQGATDAEITLAAFRYRRPMDFRVPHETGFVHGREEEIIEETDEHVIAIDAMGRRVRLCKGAATQALPMEYPVRNMDDWLKIKPHYLFDESRFGENWQARTEQAAAAGRFITVQIPGGFDEPRQLMGEEQLCYACFEQPELIHDILSAIAETAVRVLDRVSAAVQVDHLFVHEDMAGKTGPLFGPNQVAEFIKPYYRRVWDLLAERGAQLFNQDSDGNMNPVLDAFLDAGINCIHPCEPAAGMDIVAIRAKYGRRLALIGGIDKHVLRRSKDEIAAELEYKIPPMVASGACVLGLDHLIPNGTPLENYRFYIDKAWEIMSREADRLGLE